MRQEEQINPAILIWARESAGLDIKEAARKVALNSSKAESSEQKLLELERGIRLPTRSQLANFAKAYRRPLVTFYLAAPPQKASRGEDFRFTGTEVSIRENALLDALLRDIKARQEMVKNLLEDLDEANPKKIVSSATVDDGVISLAKQITAALEIPVRRADWGSAPDEFFRQLRTKTEKLGVFTLLVGDLGSHHSTLSEEVFRGFAVADPVAPFIVINDHDARTARSFTLIHELVHIFIGKGGVSGSPEAVRDNSEIGRVERFCNDVAGHVLLPPDFAGPKPKEVSLSSRDAASHYIESVAKLWMVSEPLVAFRLRRLGWITETLYRELSTSYRARWTTFKATTKAANQLKEGGPDYYVLKQSKLGGALIGVVRRTIRESLLTHTKAAKLLGVKPSSVEPLLRRYEKTPSHLAREVMG